MPLSPGSSPVVLQGQEGTVAGKILLGLVGLGKGI